MSRREPSPVIQPLLSAILLVAFAIAVAIAFPGVTILGIEIPDPFPDFTGAWREIYKYSILSVLFLSLAIAGIFTAGQYISRPHAADSPLWQRIIWHVIDGLRSPFLWIFGSVQFLNELRELRVKTDDIHRINVILSESILFTRLIQLNHSLSDNYHIVYTHQGSQPHPLFPGDYDNYRVPGFPCDEVDTVMRLWYFITGNRRFGWSNTKIRCACVFEDQKCGMK